ncbi:carbon-nitrogen hydrolase family protein [Rhodococcus sp. NPDC057014]|uniref:carbon-nitrogen hydrolase family protein n=1 Tax=Rhodococcus sp. NPDC057014 TaxID=3346000 RepID=UPI00362F963B
MSDSITISAASFAIRPVSSFDEFADHARGLLDQAAGSDLVLFPELFTLELFTIADSWQDDPVTELTRIGDYTREYRSLFSSEARERNQFIAAGSHLEYREDGYYNIAYIFGPDGEQYEHRKTHIFPAEADWSTREGDDMNVFELPFATVGFNVCYETEIPECASSLAEQGAELILCPSYTFTEYGYWRVRHCAQARAVENQVYFAHCATGGAPGGPIPSGWTQSSILSPCDLPWTPAGVVAQAPEANTENVLTGVVDLDVLRRNRLDGAATTFQDRRRRVESYRRWPSHTTARQLG